MNFLYRKYDDEVNFDIIVYSTAALLVAKGFEGIRMHLTGRKLDLNDNGKRRVLTILKKNKTK